MATINLNFGNTNIFNKNKDTKSYQYRDIGTKNFILTKDINNVIQNIKISNTSLYNDDAIKNAISNIFSFLPGEEILDQEFGNSLYNYLYKPISEAVILNIKRELYTLLSKYEPRIQINNIKVTLDHDNYFIGFTLYYTIINSNMTSMIDINF